VWINCTNLFDRPRGSGYGIGGFGREGGKEGCGEYLREQGAAAGAGTFEAKIHAPRLGRQERTAPSSPAPSDWIGPYKLYIGGAQVRPDQGYSRKILAAVGRALAEVARGP